MSDGRPVIHDKLMRCMGFISESYLSNGVAPSYEEIAIALNTSPADVEIIVEQLEYTSHVVIDRMEGDQPRVRLHTSRIPKVIQKSPIQLSPEQQAQATLNSWHTKGLISNPHNQNLLNELLTAAQTIEAARRNTRTENL